jgi:hypothetical protein
VKNTSLDILKTSKFIKPSLGFLRVKANSDGKIYTIDENGSFKAISSPWEFPIISFVSDPSTITPNINDRYIVDGGIGDFLGNDNKIAQWIGTEWEFIQPPDSCIVFEIEEERLLYFKNEWKTISEKNDNITISKNIDNENTILNIDYIIDETGTSIDGSNTPMSNASRELVTRSYVANYSSTVDDITIEKKPGAPKVGTTNIEEEVFRESWFSGCNDTKFGNGTLLNDGIIYIPPGIIKMVNTYTNPPQPRPSTDTKPEIPAGVYRLYSNIDLTPYNVKLETDSYWPNHTVYYGTSIYEKGRWLHEFNVTAPFKLHSISVDGPDHPSIYLQLINFDAYNNITSENITIVSIDKIIGADGFSLDAMSSKSKNSDKELVNKSYVDRKSLIPDEKTIHGTETERIEYSLENDENLIFNDAFGHDIPTTGWTMYDGSSGLNNNPVTLVDGIIYSNYDNVAMNYWNNLVMFTSALGGYSDANYNVYILSNINWFDSPNCTLLLTTRDGNSSRPEDVIETEDGEFLYRFQIPKGSEKSPIGFSFQVMSDGMFIPNESPYFKLVDLKNFPPKSYIKINEIDRIIGADGKSIDIDNEDSIDSSRELVTKEYVDSNISSFDIEDVISASSTQLIASLEYDLFSSFDLLLKLSYNSQKMIQKMMIIKNNGVFENTIYGMVGTFFNHEIIIEENTPGFIDIFYVNNENYSLNYKLIN